MSQENVEIVRQVYEAFNRGDWDAVYRDFAGDAEMTTPSRGLDAGMFRGVRKVRRTGRTSLDHMRR